MTKRTAAHDRDATFYANDGVTDKINCGSWHDWVQFDQGLHTLSGGGRKEPVPVT